MQGRYDATPDYSVVRPQKYSRNVIHSVLI